MSPRSGGSAEADILVQPYAYSLMFVSWNSTVSPSRSVEGYKYIPETRRYVLAKGIRWDDSSMPV